MDNKKQKAAAPEEENFSLREYASACVSRWKWFAVCIIVFCCLGYLYVLRQPPLYSRTMSVLVKDPDSSGGVSLSNAYESFGLSMGQANVNNELISMTSPAVISETVRRLHLNVSLIEKGTFHGTVLFGQNSPLTVTYAERGDTVPKGQFRIDLNTDGSYRLYKFSTRDGNDRKIKFDEEIKGRLGQLPVKTPIGELYIAPNPGYKGKMTGPMTVFAGISSYAITTEQYISKVTGDLADADAEIINLTIEDTNTERAAAVLNTLLEVYNEYWMEDKNKVNVATSKFITDRMESLRRELGDVDSEVADYQSRNKVILTEQTAQAYMDNANRVNSDLVKANNDLAMATFLRDFISNPANSNSVIPVNTGLGPALESMVSEYNRVLLNRENLLRSSGNGNPLVADYTTNLNGLRVAIDRSLSSLVGTLRTTVNTMNAENERSNSRMTDVPQQAKYLGSVRREQTVMESLYLYLLQKREETDLSQAFTPESIRVITPPYGSPKPIAPSKGMILILCFLLGLTLPAALIYVLVVTNNTVNSRKDLDDLAIPFTGEIPQVGKKKNLRRYLMSKKQIQKEIDTPKPIVAEGRRDVPNEAFRVVRSNIDLMMGRDTQEKVIMVTSFNPGSGKSFVVYNLGASFSLKGKKTLLIDGDLRHGSLSTYVGSPRRGMASYLLGHSDDAGALVRKVPGFDCLAILPIGHRPPNPAELLESDRFGLLLDRLKQDYDLIIVDCPPVNVVVDTQLLNRYADRTIFVVRSGLFKKSMIRDLVNLYEEKKLKRLSVLLNGTEKVHSSYYSYGTYENIDK